MGQAAVTGRLRGPHEPVIGTSVYLIVKLYVHVFSKSAGVVIPECFGISKSLGIQSEGDRDRLNQTAMKVHLSSPCSSTSYPQMP